MLDSFYFFLHQVVATEQVDGFHLQFEESAHHRVVPEVVDVCVRTAWLQRYQFLFRLVNTFWKYKRSNNSLASEILLPPVFPLSIFRRWVAGKTG